MASLVDYSIRDSFLYNRVTIANATALGLLTLASIFFTMRREFQLLNDKDVCDVFVEKLHFL